MSCQNVTLKDTHREKTPSNKTSELRKGMNNKLKQNFQNNKVVTGNIPFFVIGLFCTPYSIKCFVFNISAFNLKLVLQIYEKRFALFRNLFQN